MGDDTIAHRLNFGYACYMRKHREGIWTDEQWLRFNTRAEFWGWVSGKAREKTKLYLFCHNTSFDLPVLDVFGSLPSYGWVLRSAIIDAPPTILRFSNGSKSIVILDTLNFFRMPLRYLGEEIGLPKLDMPDNNTFEAEWTTYCKRDVEIIKAACIKWWSYLERENMGSFAPTLAGQSMRCFRHKYMKHRIFLDDNVKALKLTREGYYGGRVECFRIGRYHGKFKALDVNSMYPHCMAEYEYPCKLLAHTRYATLADIRLWLRTYCVTSRVLIYTDRPFIPVRREGRLVFPTGTFEAILSTPEIEYALRHANILEVLEVAVYEKAPLFREMMIELTRIKAEYARTGDTVGEFITKKLINSFYGKWGQSGGKWLETVNTDDLSCKTWIEIDVDTKRIIKHRQLGGLVQQKDEETESRDSFPAIAAHVTAHARMNLWRIIEKAGQGNSFYCDTDCLVVNEAGYDALHDEIDPYKLGALKVAGDYEDIELWGAKDYVFGHKSKTKGVRSNALWLNPHKVEQARWSGLKGLVSSGRPDAPLTKTITKNLKRLYEKGIVGSDGWVLPFRLIPGQAEPHHVESRLSDEAHEDE